MRLAGEPVYEAARGPQLPGAPREPLRVARRRPGRGECLRLSLVEPAGQGGPSAGSPGVVGPEGFVEVLAERAAVVLALVRNYIPAYRDVVDGGWSIGDIAARSYDLENKTVGIYGAGRIGQLIALRLKPFGVETLYYKRTRLETTEETTLGFRYARLEDMGEECDVICGASPLTPETRGLFDREVLFGMKRGAYLVEALEEGQLGGYAGDVWDPEPAPPDHPWRTMPRHAMTPHYSGATLDGQKRYAADTRRCFEAYFEGEPIEKDHVIVEDGEIVSGSYRAIYG